MTKELDIERKHFLGHRALILFILTKMKGTLVLAALTVAAWYGEGFVSAEPAQYALWADYAVRLLAVFTVAYFLFVFMKTYFEYRHYTYCFTDDAFIMTSGYLTSNEIAALYHQIQNVNIRRSPLDRMVGVSQVVILMIGAERDSHRAHIVLPGVGKTKAKLVQKELLTRARKHIMPNT